MNCRRCNTPIPSRSSSCPNCGQQVGQGEGFIDELGDSGVEAAAEETPLLGPSMHTDGGYDSAKAGDDQPEEELSLEDAVIPEPAPPKPAPRAARKPPRPAKAPRKPDRRKAPPRARSAATERRAAPKPSAPAKPARSAPAPTRAALPDSATVRSILAAQPELIEPGFEVLMDETGREIGIQHATDVGVIDLLGRDASGALVAVMVIGPDSGQDLVGEALHRLGWVRKHLAKEDEDVRGVVLTDQLDEQTTYAAAAVSGTLRFKRYALSLSLVDLDV